MAGYIEKSWFKIGIFLILIITATSVFYWKYSINKFNAEKNNFVEKVKDLSSDNLILIYQFSTLNASDTDSSKYSGLMMSNEYSNQGRLNYAKKFIEIDNKENEEEFKSYRDGVISLNEEIIDLYTVSSSIKFRNDALSLADYLKSMQKKQEEVFESVINFKSMNRELAEAIIKLGGDNNIPFNMTPSVNSSEDMVNIFERRTKLQEEMREMYKEFQFKYGVLRGKYNLDDLKYDNDK